METPTQPTQMAWYFRLIVFVFFLVVLACEFFVGVEFGKTRVETEYYNRLSSIFNARVLNIQKTASPKVTALSTLSENASSTQPEILESEYKLNPGWNVFSHNACSPFQIQYPLGWRVLTRIDEPEFVIFELRKDNSAKNINIKIYRNLENLSVEKWAEKQSMSRFPRADSLDPNMKIITEPYQTVNGIKMYRRLTYIGEREWSSYGLELVFTHGQYAYFIGTTEEMSENEAMEIIKTLVLGKEKDFPLWSQMKNQYPFKPNVICSAGCPLYPTWSMDWCSGKDYDMASDTSLCSCRPN